MGRMSRNKGAGFERVVAKALEQAFGVRMKRTPLSGGWAKDFPEVAGDVVCIEPDTEFMYCVECKKEEQWKLESLFSDRHAWFDGWWAQLIRECPNGKIPLLVFARNRIRAFVAGRKEDLEGCSDTFITLRHENIDIIVVTFESFLEWTD